MKKCRDKSDFEHLDSFDWSRLITKQFKYSIIDLQ